MGSRAIKGRYGVKKKNGKAVVLGILAVAVTACVAMCIGLYTMCQSWLQDLPDYTNAEAFNSAEPSVMYASDGTTVLAEFQLENREPVTYDQISPYVLQGTVATEDERFYEHNGVDFPGVARAVVNNLLGGELEGASTITQQLVRNTILSKEMTDISLKRKIREMYIAKKLEERYSKEQILLMYLNTINYGSGAYGIEAASQRYFSKPAIDLTLVEAATLVGIPQSPTYNNPIDHPENCLERRNLVLDRMLSNGYITQEEADAAKAEPLTLNPTEPTMDIYHAYPYFASYVHNQLVNPEGNFMLTKAELFEGGLSIYTTLDVDTQQAAEEAAERKLDQVGHQYEVAMVAIDPDNGYIRSMIGGKDYDTTQINMATGEGGSGRQPGSSFKTFTLVAALEAGIDPKTMVNASSTVKVPGAADVHNDSFTNWGTCSIEKAYAVSSNTAFIRLILSLGVDKVIDVAQRMGIQSDLQHVAGLTLGVSSVTPLEMADAYATIANGGIHYNPQCIERITDKAGNTIVDNTHPEGEQVISPEVAHAAAEVMKGVISSPYGTGGAARLSNGQVAGGKTGTTESMQDSWFCGITPQYAVAVWLGERAENYSDARAVYGTAASVFSDFLNNVLKDSPLEEFPDADDPKYKPYSDNKYNIGGYAYSSNSSGSSSSNSASGSSNGNGNGNVDGDGTNTSPSTSNQGGSTGGTGANNPSGGGNQGGEPTGTEPSGGEPTGAEPSGGEPTGTEPSGGGAAPEPAPPAGGGDAGGGGEAGAAAD